jgi:hypothetical protein
MRCGPLLPVWLAVGLCSAGLTVPLTGVAAPLLVAVAAEGSGQALAALDAQILSAVILAHSIWTVERFSAFVLRLVTEYPSDSELLKRIAARYKNDQDGQLDLYSSLVLQIATGPARLNVRARINQADRDMDEQGLGQFRRFLPLLMKNVDEVQGGTTISRDQRRAAILAIPSVKAAAGE